MSGSVKVLVLIYFLYQCDEVFSRKYINILTFEKEPEHGIILHHLKPISFIKETITPFGKISFRHLIEESDLHKRKRRDVDSILNLPEVEILGESKAIEEVTEKKIIPTDIILARVEFYKAKPLETINLHSSLTPFNSIQEFKVEGITPILSETSYELEDKESLKDSLQEPVPLNIPKESEKLEEHIDPIEQTVDENKSFEVKPVKVLDEGDLHDKLNEKSALEATELIEENIEKEIHEPDLADPFDANEPIKEESIKEQPIEVVPESSIIENRDMEIDSIQSNNIIENIEAISPFKIETPIVANPIEKSVEITAFPVSTLPIPVYIPLYTEIKTPLPIPAPEAPVVVSEVVNIVPPVVEVTEKVAVLPPPPPPPPQPVETVTTVIESETTPSLFSRGSRLMLNISSRILKKMLRLVAMARTRLHLGGPVEE